MNNNVDSMLEAVSSKLGITPQRLKDAKKLKSILGNPELIKKMMKSAQAQELKKSMKNQ